MADVNLFLLRPERTSVRLERSRKPMLDKSSTNFIHPPNVFLFPSGVEKTLTVSSNMSLDRLLLKFLPYVSPPDFENAL